MQTKVILEKQDLTYLSWTKTRNSSGTAGSFLKSHSDLSGERVYYKLSNYDAYKGIVGHESINELIVDRLLTIFGIKHLNYNLIHADILVDDRIHETYLCASTDFKKRYVDKVALYAYYQIEREDSESHWIFVYIKGGRVYMGDACCGFFNTKQRPHGANIEVLRNSSTKTFHLAPLFDHGLSLVFNCNNIETVHSFDVMEDKPVQCFVGSNSAKDNLKLIPKNSYPQLNPIQKSDYEIIFSDLKTVLQQTYIDKIWEMLWRRWLFYENFCNQR